MSLFARARVPLGDRLPVDAALDEAFAPLRARTTNIGPARVRAAVRWAAPEPRRLGGLALLTRISELTVAAAFSAFLFAGAITSIGGAADSPDASRDPVTAGEWTLNGRNALQRQVDSRASDYRTTAGAMAANAATARRPEEATPTHTIRDSEPFADTP